MDEVTGVEGHRKEAWEMIEGGNVQGQTELYSKSLIHDLARIRHVIWCGCIHPSYSSASMCSSREVTSCA
jgi:hypothetical protein